MNLSDPLSVVAHRIVQRKPCLGCFYDGAVIEIMRDIYNHFFLILKKLTATSRAFMVMKIVTVTIWLEINIYEK